MIKIAVPEKEKGYRSSLESSNSLESSKEKPLDRVSFFASYFEIYYYLDDSYHNWMIDNIEYHLIYCDIYHIYFEKESEAMLFKLTWS